jgi:hypothetical protein
VPLQLVEHAVRFDHRAANAAVAHQQIAAEPDPHHRRVRFETAQEGRDVGNVERSEIQIGRTAHVPGRVLRHGLGVAHARGDIGRQRERVHVRLRSTAGSGLSAASAAGRSAAAAPMLPAPIVTITSPSRAI